VLKRRKEKTNMKKKLFAGITITLFLMTATLSAIPLVSSDPGTVTIGLVGPMGWIQWDGIKEGALIAQELINTAGGMGGTGDMLQFVYIDSHAVPTPQPDLGRRDLLAALDANPDMDTIIGGFRSECVIPMREAAMDYAAANGRPIWFIAGAATDDLLKVDEDYDRYKYMFRVTPMSTTSLFTQLAVLMQSLIFPKLEYITGATLNVSIVAEQLVWCDSAVTLLETIIPVPKAMGGLGANHAGTWRPSAVATDFSTEFTAMEAADTNVIIHIFSAVAGAAFIRQWGELGVTAVPVGINVESQMQEFYAAIGGECEYETLMASVGTKTNTNPAAQPLDAIEFWEKTVEEYDHAPIYTAWGVYDAIIGFNETYAQWSGKTCDERIPLLEGAMGDRWGVLGHFKYAPPGVTEPVVDCEAHDIYVSQYAYTPIWPDGNVRSHIPQWQDGNLEVVWPRGYAPHLGLGSTDALPFAKKYLLPPQSHMSSGGVSIAETDFAGNTAPTGVGGNFLMPDGQVDSTEMTQLTTLWQMKVPWTLLEADMDGDQLITVTDISRVAIDFGQSQ
jgi:branched-chain amino acid transport system substrate-binding protein